LKESPLELTITPKGNDDGFLFFFARALDGVPLTNLGRCAECNKWFLQSGKRERHFCSNLCRAKSSRERRKKNSEKRDPIVRKGSGKRRREDKLPHAKRVRAIIIGGKNRKKTSKESKNGDSN
jgi:hypothetical protein